MSSRTAISRARPVGFKASRSHHHTHGGQSKPRVKVLDWDKDELLAVMGHDLHYTMRSSKYPRTQQKPHRTTLIITPTQHYSIHTILLTTFSSTLSSALKSSTTPGTLRATYPPHLLPGWRLFLEWLYTLDKVPLPDFTPIRREHWSTSQIISACLLASHLKATKFEKYLLRIIFKELWDGDFPESDIAMLGRDMGKHTGMWHFSRAYLRWRAEEARTGGGGNAGELDPYRWRVEHWYSICGTLGNYGCFHAMNTSGWGGVWERQRGLAEQTCRENDVWGVVEIFEDGDAECEGYSTDDEDMERGAWRGRAHAGSGLRGHEYSGRYSLVRRPPIRGKLEHGRPRHAFQSFRLVHPHHRSGHRLLSGAHSTDGSVSASGEELWEEWWEHDDAYSAFPADGHLVGVGSGEAGDGDE